MPSSLLTVLLILAPTGAALALEEPDILGFWRPDGGDRVEIVRCGENICGYVRPINPDPEDHDGHFLLDGFRYKGDMRWKKGRIHDPDSGRTYKAKLRLMSKNELKVTGCVWIFCGSQTWTRRD